MTLLPVLCSVNPASQVLAYQRSFTGGAVLASSLSPTITGYVSSIRRNVASNSFILARGNW